MPNYDPLAQKRIQRMLRALMDVRQIPANLKYLNRTSIQFATDQEIMARITERSIIADIVADDQAATVDNDHSITLEATKIPNIKRGSSITQEMLNLLNRIKAGVVMSGDENIFENYLQGRLESVLKGVRMQMNLMCAGRLLDSYSWTGRGIQTGVVVFGTPSDLKVTVNVSWATAATATPIADIQAIRITAREKYGKEYNRVTLSTTDYRNMVATTEFRNLASGLRYFNFNADQFPTQNDAMMKAVASQLLDGMEIEIDDSQYGRKAPDGSHSYTRFLPVNKVVLTNSSDDSDPAIADFANGIVTETVVGSMNINGAPSIFSGPQEGPVGFATLPNMDLNPPNANVWGVVRGFPRKHDQTESAILTVG